MNSVSEMEFAELELIIRIGGRLYRLVELNQNISTECRHENRIDVSVMGLKSWLCKDCGYREDSEISNQ
jgi:hypothetical protein